MKKKIFAVSDIHGYYTEFKNAIEAAGFDSGNSEHLLVFCGDLFDRGTENVNVLKYFERTENCVMLRGNHEDMFMKILLEGKLKPHNYINGTVNTLLEFFGKYSLNREDNLVDFSGQNSTVDRIIDLITPMKDYYETGHYIFTHGWLPNRRGAIFDSWKKASETEWEDARFTRWTEVYNGNAPLKEKTLVCGHVPVFYAKRFDKKRESNDSSPFYGNGLIAIDAGTYDTHKVNVVILEDDLIE